MLPNTQIKSCLVISYGPVPTPQYQTIEGGGMRAWGLAKGLLAHGIEVTIAVNASFPQELPEHEGVHLTNWATDQRFVDLMGSFDAVIASYCMGSDSVFIADHIPNDVQLILDVYVPIYVEVSARESGKIDDEYVNYMADIKRFNHVLARGDYFLCASAPQKIFYTGVLGSLGIINPRSYRQNRILIVPFGLHDEPLINARNPYKDELGFTKADFTVLWFGGLYPWFRVEELLNAIKRLSANKRIKFVIVGGKNPFNPNPDFSKQYTFAESYAKEHTLLNSSLYFIDWVDFNDRVNWFINADLIISINNPGEENSFSWRTRVMDFVWAETPILTNGEDVLSEQLLAHQAAAKLPELSEKAIADKIEQFAKHPDDLKKIAARVAEVKTQYYWHKIVEPLVDAIKMDLTPSTEERVYQRTLPALQTTAAASSNRYANSIKSKLRLIKKGVAYAQKYGLMHTARLTRKKIEPHLPFSLPAKKRPKQYVFVSHPINNSGAPLVLLQMIDETITKHGGRNVRLIAPHIDSVHLRRLRTSGVRVEHATAAHSDEIIRLQLTLDKHDFLLINTLAVSVNYLRFVLGALESGTLAQAYWFVHEDISQLGPLKSELLDENFKARVQRLVNAGNLRILVPSERVRTDYNELLGTTAVTTLPYRVDVPDQFKVDKKASDYQSLNFLLSGAATDGRKGQFIAVSAFYTFLKEHYEKAPADYRPFKLELIAIGEDFISQQVKSLATQLLGAEHVAVYPPMAREQALDITAGCNAVICCSLNETFAIYVAEGMLMGHVVLRNGSAGMEEQLEEGKNGYYINEQDIRQFAGVLEKLLNKKQTSNEQLQKMGQRSMRLIKPFAKNTYLDKIDT